MKKVYVIANGKKYVQGFKGRLQKKSTIWTDNIERAKPYETQDDAIAGTERSDRKGLKVICVEMVKSFNIWWYDKEESRFDIDEELRLPENAVSLANAYDAYINGCKKDIAKLEKDIAEYRDQIKKARYEKAALRKESK